MGAWAWNVIHLGYSVEGTQYLRNRRLQNQLQINDSVSIMSMEDRQLYWVLTGKLATATCAFPCLYMRGFRRETITITIKWNVMCCQTLRDIELNVVATRDTLSSSFAHICYAMGTLTGDPAGVFWLRPSWDFYDKLLSLYKPKSLMR